MRCLATRLLAIKWLHLVVVLAASAAEASAAEAWAAVDYMLSARAAAVAAAAAAAVVAAMAMEADWVVAMAARQRRRTVEAAWQMRSWSAQSGSIPTRC
jgi:hypothetical protein